MTTTVAADTVTRFADGTTVAEAVHGDHIDLIAQTPGRRLITLRVDGYTELAYSVQARTAAAADKARAAALMG